MFVRNEPRVASSPPIVSKRNASLSISVKVGQEPKVEVEMCWSSG